MMAKCMLQGEVASMPSGLTEHIVGGLEAFGGWQIRPATFQI